MNLDVIRNAITSMKHSGIRNYVTPGLTSWLVGGEGHGKIRLFTADRDTREWVTPHSHRFDFTCMVLAGSVTNILFSRTGRRDQGNAYAVGILRAPTGGIGAYEFRSGEEVGHFDENSYVYSTGETYGMRHHEIHSIRFSRGAVVLFLEGAEVTTESVVLEPWSDGRRVPTFATQPWMFDRSVETQPGEPT